jgi:hypothetical protein
MDTSTYKMKENPTSGKLETVSAWRTPRFQIFAAIAAGTALLLSLVAGLNLQSGVDNLTQKKVPQLQSQIDNLKVR